MYIYIYIYIYTYEHYYPMFVMAQGGFSAAASAARPARRSGAGPRGAMPAASSLVYFSIIAYVII